MKHSYLVALSALVLLSACNSGKKELAEPSDVRIIASRVNTSFAGSISFQPGSTIGVYMTTASSNLLIAGNLADNITFTAGDGGSFTTTSAIEYPAVGGVDFYAYSPISAVKLDSDKKLSFTVAADQSSLDASDLLWVSKKGIMATASPVAMAFDHLLSKVAVKLIAGTGVTLSGTVLNVNSTLPTVKFNMQAGALDNATGAARAILPFKISETEREAIIIPQSIAKGVELFQIKNGGETFSYKMPDAKTFESGKSYTYDITVNKTTIVVKFTGTINGWTAGGTTTGDAI